MLLAVMDLLLRLGPLDVRVSEIGFKLDYGERVGQSKMKVLRTIRQTVGLLARRRIERIFRYSPRQVRARRRHTLELVNPEAHLRKVVTQLKDYRLDVQRISHVDGRRSYVELTESCEIDGAPAPFPPGRALRPVDAASAGRLSAAVVAVVAGGPLVPSPAGDADESGRGGG